MITMLKSQYKKKIIICAVSALLITALAAGAACAAVKVKKGDLPSQDIQLRDTAWTQLAEIYPIPAVSSDSSAALTPEILSSWWDAFGDPELTSLIKMALEKNRTLAASQAKLKQARMQLGVTRASLLPWLDTTNYWSNQRTPVAAGGTGNTNNIYRLGIDATWEIDVFGQQSLKVASQKLTMEAQYAALYGAWTSLASEVAVDYISLRTLQERLDIAKYNLNIQENSVSIQQSKVDSGLADALALNQAKYTMEQTRAIIPQVETSIEEMKNALAILTGEVPGALEERLSAKKAIPEISDTAYVGIPANAIRQRPDIRQAERALMAQIAQKRVAEKDLWPKFSLTGSIGTEGGNWGSLFGGPAKLYSFMPQISWPIFHAGAIRSNIKVQGAAAEQLMNAYEQTVLTAVGEVRNALSANVQQYDRSASLKRGMEAAQVALDVANDKYANGLVDFLTVINAQSALTSLSEQYTISRGAISTNAVQLFNALGGGWKPMDEAQQALAEAEMAAKKAKK